MASSSNLCCKSLASYCYQSYLQFAHRTEICSSEHRPTVSGLALSTNVLSEVTHQTLHLLHIPPLHCMTLSLVVTEPAQSISASSDSDSEMTCSCKPYHSTEQRVCISSCSGCSQARLVKVKPSLRSSYQNQNLQT